MDTLDRYNFLQDLHRDSTGAEALTIPFLNEDGRLLTGTENNSVLNDQSPLSMNKIRNFLFMSANPNGQARAPLFFVQTRGAITDIFLDGDVNLADPRTVNAFCHILDSKQATDVIMIHLGVMMYGLQAFGIGAILSAMDTCEAKIITIAHGRCGFPESMIWCYGHERHIFPYGELMFEGEFTFKDDPNIRSYFETFKQKVESLGIMTAEQIDAVFEKNQIAFVYPNVPK